MYKLIVICVCFFFPWFVYTQPELSGTVKDSVQPISFANISIKDQNNNIIKGAITDKNGMFKVSVPSGSYGITISFLGYKKWDTEIIIDQNKNLGIVILEKQSSKLSEVLILGKKKFIERKIDRMVFNTESFGGIQGGDGLELLNLTPGILVSNDQIQMIGKNTMSLMVNGRICLLYTSDAADD